MLMGDGWDKQTKFFLVTGQARPSSFSGAVCRTIGAVCRTSQAFLILETNSRQGVVESACNPAVVPAQLRAAFWELEGPGLPKLPVNPIESSQMLCGRKSWEQGRQRRLIPRTPSLSSSVGSFCRLQTRTRVCGFSSSQASCNVQRELHPVVAENALHEKIQILS